MDGHYYQLPGPGGYYPNEQPVVPLEIIPPDVYGARMHRLQTMSSETLDSYEDMEDPGRGVTSTQSGPKSKRRQVHGPDHIKHRRTRSGCYTCRQRRVKCDENRPCCERCRKGKRECIYPEPNAPKSARDSKGKPFLPDEGSFSSGEDYDGNEDRLASIPDDEEDAASNSAADVPGSSTTIPVVASEGVGKTVMSPTGDKMKSPTSILEPPSATSTKSFKQRPVVNRQASRQSVKTNHMSSARWSHLSKDVRFYIKYHRDHLTHHHYSLKYDGGDFLKTTFLEIALGYEPLLYAITAFSAYFHTLAMPNGKVQYFLGYYDKSVSLLRQSLLRSPRHTVATLLTILQLATFEEYLGDWVNLLGHQKAAYEILTELFTPQTIMQSETHRKIIGWYIRFDLFAGLLSGYEAALSREWHLAYSDFYIRQVKDRPNDLGSLFEEKTAGNRLLATDIASLFGRKAKNGLGDEEFMAELLALKADLARMDEELTNAFADTRKYVKDFPGALADDVDTVVDSTDPNFVLADELFPWNFLLIDFWGMYFMFASQVAQFERNPPTEQLAALAFKICKMFEALQYVSSDSDAIVLGAQASLGIAALGLPKDYRHTMWCRKKYARVEACGYVYPAILRKRMSDVWGEDVSRWWLPNDENYPPMMKAVREFIDYRARVPQDTATEDLRDMKGLLAAMSLEDGDSRADSKSTSTGSDHIDTSGLEGFLSCESSPDMKWD